MAGRGSWPVRRPAHSVRTRPAACPETRRAAAGKMIPSDEYEALPSSPQQGMEKDHIYGLVRLAYGVRAAPRSVHGDAGFDVKRSNAGYRENRQTCSRMRTEPDCRCASGSIRTRQSGVPGIRQELAGRERLPALNSSTVSSSSLRERPSRSRRPYRRLGAHQPVPAISCGIAPPRPRTRAGGSIRGRGSPSDVRARSTLALYEQQLPLCPQLFRPDRKAGSPGNPDISLR